MSVTLWVTTENDVALSSSMCRNFVPYSSVRFLLLIFLFSFYVPNKQLPALLVSNRMCLRAHA